MPTPRRWKLTLAPDASSPTVLTGLSSDEMRQAVSALMSGDDHPIAQLKSRSSADRIDRAA